MQKDRITVTKELSRFLKDRRSSLRINAREFSRKIDMAPAHISKVENNLIKSMNYERLIRWITALYDKLDRSVVREIYEYFLYWYPKDTVLEQKWLLRIDYTFVKVGIPKQITDRFSNFMRFKTVEHLHSPMLMLSPRICPTLMRLGEYSEFVNDTYIWIPEGGIGSNFRDVFEGRVTEVPFAKIFTFTLSMYHEGIYKGEVLTESQLEEVTAMSLEVLSQYDIHTVWQEVQSIRKENSSKLLGTYDVASISQIKTLAEIFKSLGEQDMKLVSQRLDSFIESLRWDAGFMLKLISLNYKTNLNSFQKRKELLNKIEALVKEYRESVKDVPNANLREY